MAEKYVHFFRLVRLYHEARQKMHEQNTSLMTRMLRGGVDSYLQKDLNAYYDKCYVSRPQKDDSRTESCFDCAAVIDCLDHDGINNSHIARWCGVSNAQVTKWKNGTKPRKHVWWRIALHTKLPLELLPAFLAIADCAYDPLCRQDVIMLHGQLMKYSVNEIMRQLQETGCLNEK